MRITTYLPMRFAPPHLLPAKFRYPASYVAYVKDHTGVDGPHWDWCLFHDGDGDYESYVETVKQLYPGRVLVPFMRVNGEEGVVCFDATIPSEDPPVICGTSSAADDRGHGYLWGEFANFAEWVSLVPERHPN